MGSFEARKGRWGGFTDIVYMNLGDSRSESRQLSVGGNPLPAGATANLDYDLKGFMWTLAASYRAVADPTATLDVFAGARLADVEEKLNFEVSGNIGPIPLPGRSGSRTGQRGLLGRHRGGERPVALRSRSTAGSSPITSISGRVTRT